MFTEWDEETIRTWPGEFFEYYIGPREGLLLRALRLYVRSPKARAVFCKPDWAGIARPFSSATQKQVTEADTELAVELMGRLGEGRVFRSAHELSDAYRKLLSLPR